MQLRLPRRVRAGDPVGITLTVENQTPRALDLYLRGRDPIFDVIIASGDGAVVWRRLEDAIIPAIVSLRTLASAERLELQAVWDQRTREGIAADAGEYTATALLLVEGDPLETESVTFRIS